MVEDLLQYSSPGQLNRFGCSAVEIIRDSLFEAVSVVDGNHTISLKYDFRHTFELNADRYKVQRVFVNLISNSMQSMGKTGEISFQTEDARQENKIFLRCSVKNTGSHIVDEDLKSIFDMFYTKRGEGGTGLGLAIVKRIVTDHGGSIKCHSSIEGGVRFTFTLPGHQRSDTSKLAMPKCTSETGPFFLMVSAIQRMAHWRLIITY